MFKIYKISIIIPVFNLEDLIERAFNSILNQSIGFDNLEVIFVDDCSTDNSKYIISEYSRKYDNVKGIYLNENSGYGGKPRNIGLKYASGEYIMFLDSDDYYLPNACELLYDRISSEEMDFVSGNFAIDNIDNVVRWNHINIEDEIKIKRIFEKPSLFVLSPAIWSKIYRKDFLFKNNIQFVENLPGQDALFMYTVLTRANGMLFINTPVVIYCNRDYSVIEEKSVTDDVSYEKLSAYILIYNRMADVLLKYNKEYAVVVSSHLSYWSNLFRKSNLEHCEKISLLNDFSKLYKKIHATVTTDEEIVSLLDGIDSNIISNLVAQEHYPRYIDNLFYNIERDPMEFIEELNCIEEFVEDNSLIDYNEDFLLFKILNIIDILDAAKYVDTIVHIPQSKAKRRKKRKRFNYAPYYNSTSEYLGFSYEHANNIFLKIKDYLNDKNISLEDIQLLKENYNNPSKLDKFIGVLDSKSYEKYMDYCASLKINDMVHKKNKIDMKKQSLTENIESNEEIIDNQKRDVEKSLKELSNRKSEIKQLDYDYYLMTEENKELISETKRLRDESTEITNSNTWKFGMKFKC